jgi:hypothetical protein
VTSLLRQALDRAAEVLSAEEQDELARTLLGFIENERKWDAAFSSPQSLRLLERLAADALQDDRVGKTDKLDPDAL